jgi:hypothetical protein
MSLIWLATIPWDLSEIDPDGDVVSGGGDEVFATWKTAALALGWFAVAAGVTAAPVSRSGRTMDRSVKRSDPGLTWDHLGTPLGLEPRTCG